MVAGYTVSDESRNSGVELLSNHSTGERERRREERAEVFPDDDYLEERRRGGRRVEKGRKRRREGRRVLEGKEGEGRDETSSRNCHLEDSTDSPLDVHNLLPPSLPNPQPHSHTSSLASTPCPTTKKT